jgi:hypothetical protein
MHRDKTGQQDDLAGLHVLAVLLSHPRNIDPALPDDGGAGGITDPEGGETGDEDDPRSPDNSEEETEEIEVGDPRDGP